MIHPKQIAPVKRAYAVSAEDVAYYEKVVREFETAEKSRHRRDLGRRQTRRLRNGRARETHARSRQT